MYYRSIMQCNAEQQLQTGTCGAAPVVLAGISQSQVTGWALKHQAESKGIMGCWVDAGFQNMC